MKNRWAGLCAVLLGAPVIAATANGEVSLRSSYLLAASDSDAPLSKEDLFGVGPAEKKPAQPLPAAPDSKDSLFGLEAAPPKPASPVAQESPAAKEDLFGIKPAVAPAPQPSASLWHGYLQTELAYGYARPEHWSKTMGRFELGTQGQLGSGINWKASARLDYNPVYDLNHYYSSAVRRDQRAALQLRETYLDFSAGGLDWRVGRQHVVWGEMVGLFFADVVSAKDLREFVLPDFQVLRIPQWAARAEYFRDDFHAEAVWIPFPSYDNIGKPFDPAKPGAGADFYPYPISPAGVALVQHEAKPDYGLNHTNGGLRLSKIVNGWDLSGFWYSSMDAQATLYRDPINQQLFYPRHKRIGQGGATLAKDLGAFVLKAETVYTAGRRYNTQSLLDSDGVVKQDTLDWVVGLDFTPGTDTRLNTQFFQRIYFNHDAGIVPDAVENGLSLLVNQKFLPNWEGEMLLVHSLNRSDWMLRPKLSWKFQPNWRLTSGVDIFSGPATGLFGRYDNQDRVYTELRRDF